MKEDELKKVGNSKNSHAADWVNGRERIEVNSYLRKDERIQNVLQMREEMLTDPIIGQSAELNHHGSIVPDFPITVREDKDF